MAVLCLLLVVLCATTSRAAGVGGRARIRAGALSSERHEAGALAGAVRARADAARDAAGHAAELSTLNEPMTLDCSGATPTSTNSWSVTKLSAWRDLDFYESLLNLFQDSHTNFKSLHNFRYLKMVTCLYTGESNSAHQFLVGHGGKKKQQPKYVAGPALPPVRVMVLLNFKGEGEHAEFKGGFVVGDTEHSMKGATLRLKGYRLASKRATDNPTGRGNVKVQRSSSILKVRFKPDATGRSPTDEAKKVFHYAIEYGQPAITYVSAVNDISPLAATLAQYGAEDRMVVLSRALNLTASAPIIAQGVADAVKRLDRYFYEDDAQQDENKASLFTADDATSSYIILTADSAVKEHVLAVQTAERVRTRAPPMAQNVFTIAEWIGSNALIAPIANLFTSTTKPRVADVDKKVGALLKDISEVVPKGVAKAALALLPPV